MRRGTGTRGGGVENVVILSFLISFRGKHRLPFRHAGRERLRGRDPCVQLPVIRPHHGRRAVHAHGRGESVFLLY